MVARDLAPWVWDELLMAGRPLGIMPAGVAARESLRTEAGYLLNGNDMDPQTNPIEAGLEWVVKPAKDFIGRDALARIKAQGVARKLVGLEVEGNHTIRNGYPIYRGGKEVGKVTSGPLSPQLTGRNLGLGYVASEHAEIGTELEVGIRRPQSRAHVVATPFSARRVKHEPAVSYLFPLRLALQPIPRVGVQRRDRGECGRHRPVRFWATQPGRHLEPGSAEGRGRAW